MNSKEYKPIMVTGAYCCGKGALLSLLDSPKIFTIPQWHDMLIDIFYHFVESFERYSDDTHWRGKDDRVIILGKKLAEQDYPMLEQYAIMKKLMFPIASTRIESYDFNFDYYKHRQEFFKQVWTLEKRDISVKTLFNIFVNTFINNIHNLPNNDYEYFASASEPGFCDFENLIQVYPEIKIVYIYRKDWIFAYSNRNKAMGSDLVYVMKNDKRFNGIIKAEARRHYFEKSYPSNFKVVDFDELINNPKETARKIIEFIGLEWDAIYGIPSFLGNNIEDTEIVGQVLDSKDRLSLLPDEETAIRQFYESRLSGMNCAIGSDPINYLEQNATQEAAESKDISVIVQGSVDFQETKKCLMSVRKNLPEAEIILSTWEGSETKGLDYDVLVLSTDPGSMPMEPITWKINNVNRQITSTLNGIKKATRKYILKIRTDSRIDNLGFLNCFNDNIFQNLKRDKDYSVLKRRVAIGSHFTRDPLHGNLKLLFHPSDLWFFGLKEDLENIFDIPLQTKFIVTINGRKYQYRVPEQYIWTSCLEKNGFSFFMDSLLYNTPLLADISIKSILNNFIVLDSKRCGIRFPAKFKNHSKGVMNDSILSTAKYFEFYRKFYDNNYDPPKIFTYDNIKDALGIANNVAEIKGILASNDLFRMARCILAVGYKSIRNSYKLLWQLK